MSGRDRDCGGSPGEAKGFLDTGVLRAGVGVSWKDGKGLGE